MTDISPPTEAPALQILDEEALKPVNLMERMLKEAAALPQAEPRRGPGRPKGSRNRSTIEREQGMVSPPGGAKIITPPRRIPGISKPVEERTPEEIKAIKASRVIEYQQKISETVNENIILLLLSMGVPGAVLYKPGMQPKRVEEASRYTEIAGNVLISPLQASVYAKFLAEAETTKVGKQLTGLSGDGSAPLIIYGLLSLGATVQYVKGLQTFLQQLKPLLEMIQANKAAQQAQAAASNGTGGNSHEGQ